MEIDRQDIRLALRGFLELLESADQQAKIETLELWLGQLAFLQHFVEDIPSDDKLPALPVRDAAYWTKLIATHFPSLGNYNTMISAETGDFDLSTGNAIDDLAEIAAEISECVQRWNIYGENQALWYFRVGYQMHWEKRLRNLQRYLYNRPWG